MCSSTLRGRIDKSWDLKAAKAFMHKQMRIDCHLISTHPNTPKEDK